MIIRFFIDIRGSGLAKKMIHFGQMEVHSFSFQHDLIIENIARIRALDGLVSFELHFLKVLDSLDPQTNARTGATRKIDQSGF